MLKEKPEFRIAQDLSSNFLVEIIFEYTVHGLDLF
jgi:hypothetical protein